MDMIEQLVSQLKNEMDARVPVQTVWAECLSVDTEQGTMVAVREELEYHDVLIGHGVDMRVPKPGTAVLLGVIENKAAATFLILAEAYQAMRINGDAYGGIPRADVIASDLNVLVDQLNQLKQALVSWVPVPNDGGASLKLHIQAWASAPIAPVQEEALQNPSVSHG